MSVRRRVRVLCYLCRRDTAKALSRLWPSLRGTWVATLNTNLYRARTRVRSQWDSLARYGAFYVKRASNRLSKHALIRSLSQPRLGLPLWVAGMLLLVWVAVSLVKALISLLSMTL